MFRNGELGNQAEDSFGFNNLEIDFSSSFKDFIDSNVENIFPVDMEFGTCEKIESSLGDIFSNDLESPFANELDFAGDMQYGIWGAIKGKLTDLFDLAEKVLSPFGSEIETVLTTAIEQVGGITETSLREMSPVLQEIVEQSGGITSDSINLASEITDNPEILKVVAQAAPLLALL